MGNASSYQQGDGIPFVSWRSFSSTDANANANADADASEASTDKNAASSRSGSSHSIGGGFTALANVAVGGATTWHFAEPSCYRYDKCPRALTGSLVFADPPKVDGELRNQSELLGNIVVVERGGRVHFPDVIRRVLAAGAIGCIFIERATTVASQSLFDGFHSSGRQRVAIPIVLLSTYHADHLVRDKPTRVTIELLSGEAAIQHIVQDDQVVVVSTAARAGEVEVLKHVLYSDTTGSIRERIFKAVALCDAAEGNHVDGLEILHGFGIGLDEQKPNGTTALMMACSVGNVEAARALLMFGANVDLEDVHGLTALMVAARDGKLHCVKLLIRKGARINLSRNRNRGTTALHIAARAGQEECVSVLLEAGAALEVHSPNSTTALMEAARAGNLGCVRLLLDAGASLDAKDREGHTAEALARLSGHTEIEEFLRERAESESVKDHRRQIEEAVTNPETTLQHLLSIAQETSMAVDVLKREITRDVYASWLQQPRIIFDVFRLLTQPTPQGRCAPDPVYGEYKVQYFCCEIALWYPRRIFEKASRHHSNASLTPTLDELDIVAASKYLKVLFGFLSHAGELDDVLVVLFCKVLNHFTLHLHLGKLVLRFLASDGQVVVQWLVNHIGLDSIRDMLVWLLYSDMSDDGQADIRKSGIFDSLFSRLFLWQRTLSWGVGTPYQRDSIENICLLINYIVYPPAVYMLGNVATFVENSDPSLPLITDQFLPDKHNELLKSLLLFCHASELSFGTLIDLGFAEVFRQSTQTCALVVHEGGTLSILMMVMSTLGYHKRKRDVTGIEKLLQAVRGALLDSLLPRVAKFVKLCDAVVHKHEQRLRELVQIPQHQQLHVTPKGSALLYNVSFLKRCVFLQEPELNAVLAAHGLMPCLLQCYAAHPSNNLLHHELTDVVRFVLMDPDRKRSPSCPLLTSLFQPPAKLLDFVTRSYDAHVEYKGHLTTIANSIFTLTNTPTYKSSESATATRGQPHASCQAFVQSHTLNHASWAKFEAILAEQNLLEMQPLGQRHAPLCDGCLKLKEHAIEYVTSTLTADVTFTGYLETLFSGAASHCRKVNTTEDFVTGFLFKKDKIHDHIPIPEPTRVSSFIQFPVPMPFHALTFTMTYFGLCRKCDKLWYCDTLASANWANRMKWVIPTSVRKWYSFGVSEGPGSGAHGIQFSTKGYKNFIVLSDTWGRQEQWMHAFEEAILGLSSQAARRMDAANALAIEIDNEVDASEFDFKGLSPNVSPTRTRDDAKTKKTTKTTKTTTTTRLPDEEPNRRRSKTISESIIEMEKLDKEFSSDEDSDSDASESKLVRRQRPKAPPKTPALRTKTRPGSAQPRPVSSNPTTTPSATNLTTSPAPSRVALENALRTGKPLPISPPKKQLSSIRSSGSERNLSQLDRKQFQEDAKRYTEILNNLKLSSTAMSSGASPPQSSSTRSPILSSPIKLRALHLSTGTGTGTSSTSNDVPPRRVSSTSTLQAAEGDGTSLPAAIGVRHVVSSRDLTSLGRS